MVLRASLCLSLILAVVSQPSFSSLFSEQGVPVTTSEEPCSVTVNMKEHITYSPFVDNQTLPLRNTRNTGVCGSCPTPPSKECRITFTVPDEMDKELFRICYHPEVYRCSQCQRNVTFKESSTNGTSDLETLACSSGNYSGIYTPKIDNECLRPGQNLEIFFYDENFCSHVRLIRMFPQENLLDQPCDSGHLHSHANKGTLYSRQGKGIPVSETFCTKSTNVQKDKKRREFCYSFHYADFQPDGATLHISDQSGNDDREYGYNSPPEIGKEYCVRAQREPYEVKIFLQSDCSSANKSECALHLVEHAFVLAYEIKVLPDPVDQEDDNTGELTAMILCPLAFFLICGILIFCVCRKKKRASNSTYIAAAPSPSQSA
ncbi:uncharacterized protein LOC101847665 [Aplysia californica]|uniref:Uncharacterized protein LOC101847665 n=1 Tax=Aplysia californica TaxID=6500 RepID=A0ABM0JT14_APLCA|nr:uncharacterized protein LOC101847665 [Aplysia californica]